MAIYTLSSQYVKSKKRRILLSQLLSPILISGIFIYSWYNTENKENFWNIFGDTILMIAIMLPIYSFYLVRRAYKRFDSYKVTITETSVIVDTYKRQPIVVERSEISNIIKYTNGNYLVQCTDSRKNIALSTGIENETAFESELGNISPNSINKSMASKYISIMFFVFIAIGLYGGFMDKQYAKGIFALFMCSFCLWYGTKVVRSKHTSKALKVTVYTIFTLVVILIIFGLIIPNFFL